MSCSKFAKPNCDYHNHRQRSYSDGNIDFKRVRLSSGTVLLDAVADGQYVRPDDLVPPVLSCGNNVPVVDPQEYSQRQLISALKDGEGGDDDHSQDSDDFIENGRHSSSSLFSSAPDEDDRFWSIGNEPMSPILARTLEIEMLAGLYDETQEPWAESNVPANTASNKQPTSFDPMMLPSSRDVLAQNQLRVTNSSNDVQLGVVVCDADKQEQIECNDIDEVSDSSRHQQSSQSTGRVTLLSSARSFSSDVDSPIRHNSSGHDLFEETSNDSSTIISISDHLELSQSDPCTDHLTHSSEVFIQDAESNDIDPMPSEQQGSTPASGRQSLSDHVPAVADSVLDDFDEDAAQVRRQSRMNRSLLADTLRQRIRASDADIAMWTREVDETDGAGHKQSSSAPVRMVRSAESINQWGVHVTSVDEVTESNGNSTTRQLTIIDSIPFGLRAQRESGGNIAIHQPYAHVYCGDDETILAPRYYRSADT